MRRAAALMLLAPLVFAAALEAVAAPRLEAGRERWVVTALPSLLDDDEVREHLTTGLTTSFDIRLELRDREGRRITAGRALAGAQVLVRYKLWEEVFEVAAGGADGAVEVQNLASHAELDRWWRGLRLVVLESAGLEVATDKVRLTLDVVPFSRAERDDARRWFSESLDRAGRSSAEETAQSADEPPDRLSRVFNLLLATSIQRRTLCSYRWTVDPVEVEG